MQAISVSRPGIERLNVHQLHQMIELGILREGEPIELIDGILVRKDNSDAGGDPMTHGPKHAFCVQQVMELNAEAKPHGWHLRQQLPITLTDNREPEPDVALVRGGIADYQDCHPGPSDCAAVIEVADSSLEYDRTVKAPIYASAQIPVLWIVNIPDRQIEVYQSPHAAEGRYDERTDFKCGQTAPLDLGEGASVVVKVDSILP
jgi:Uma2 family endonuclease